MDVLKMLIENYQQHEMPLAYKLILKSFCEAEREFMNSLDEKQRSKYFELDSKRGELNAVERDEFAGYLIKALKEYRK